MDTTVADALLGSLIDGRYRIQGRVARGGMATVYTAVDERLERTVALKIIQPSQATNVHFVDRFTDEAKTIARLTHPNIVAVYDQGRYEGLPYLVMEYVHGSTLRELLSQRRRLNPVEALAILEQMLSAIAAAHRAGLVHRDVKPENVLVAAAPSGGVGNLVDSVVKVADFGLARAVEASADDETGQLLATVAYVAPELVTDGHADARTDVYSAGIVLFEMLTGRVPYDGAEPVEVAWKHVDNDVPAPSSIVRGLLPALDDLVARATRRDAGVRPTDAGALLSEVQVVRDHLGAANVETALLRQVPRPQPPAPTALVPTVTTTGPVAARPAWSRLPETTGRTHTGQRRRPASRRAVQPGWWAPIQQALSARLAAIGGGSHGPGSGGPGSGGPGSGGPGSGGPGSGRRGSSARGRGDSRIAMPLAVGAIVLTVLVSAWWIGFGRYTNAPQLVNANHAQAQAAAERDGFTVALAAGAYSETAAKDIVLSQFPAPGGRVVRGGTITITLSLGPERYPVPDMVGIELTAAQGELATANLVLKQGKDVFSDTLPKGTVAESDPPAGTPLKAGSVVTVTVSQGRAPISVPDIAGKRLNINDARNELARLGLNAVEQYKDSDQPADTVIGQSPAPGTGVAKDTEVKLDVSKGPPQVIMPRVVDQPCQQARQQLEGAGLRVRIDINPNGVVRGQNPGENTPLAPQTEVSIQCL